MGVGPVRGLSRDGALSDADSVVVELLERGVQIARLDGGLG